MNRLNFSLPEFTRIIWASELARNTWEPRINMINTIWPIVERETVVMGIRPGALQSIVPEQLINLQNWCLANDQSYAILIQEGSSSVYGNASKPYIPTQPWTYRVYIGQDVHNFLVAWATGNNRQIAKALNYPSCCAEFFATYWHDGGWRDLTYAMTNFKPGLVDGPSHCNILLRQLGIRPVFHLPCSFDCAPTIEMSKHILSCLDRLGYHREAEWLYEILSWPVRWSSLHGVAMITTPCMKIITSTDALPETVVIDRAGTIYPEEGSTGSYFPFKDKVIKIGTKDNWTDNGFADRANMRVAHDLLIDTIGELSLAPGFVLDLGCGNGLLLDKIHTKYDFLEPIGVESDPERAAKARLRLTGGVYRADIVDSTVYMGNYELILISLNRFKEIEPEKLTKLLKHFSEHTHYLFVYSYDKWEDEKIAGLLTEYFKIRNREINHVAEVRVFTPIS